MSVSALTHPPPGTLASFYSTSIAYPSYRYPPEDWYWCWIQNPLHGPAWIPLLLLTILFSSISPVSSVSLSQSPSFSNPHFFSLSPPLICPTVSPSLLPPRRSRWSSTLNLACSRFLPVKGKFFLATVANGVPNVELCSGSSLNV